MFKIGDKVRVLSSAKISYGGKLLRGKVGTIIKIGYHDVKNEFPNNGYVCLDIEDELSGGIWMSEITLEEK